MANTLADMATQSKQTPTSGSSRGPLSDAVRTWDRFWFGAVDPATICFIRVCCAALAFYVTLTYSWNLLSYVGPHAWVDAEMSRFMLHEVETYVPTMQWVETYRGGQGLYFWSIYYHVTNPGWIVVIHVFFLANMLLYSLGLGCRYTGVLSWIGAMSYPQRSWATVYGLDTMLMILLAYLMIAPSGARFSLDRWLALRRARRLGLPEPTVKPSSAANFAVRLIQVHLCLVYFAGGTSKLLGSMWWNGTALNQVLLNSLYSPMESPFYYRTLKFLANHRWLWELFTASGNIFTLGLELSFIFLVWDQRWRWFLLSCFVMLHTGIGLFMGLTTFSIVMMIMLSSFLPPELILMLIDQFSQQVSSLSRRRVKQLPAPTEKLVLSR